MLVWRLKQGRGNQSQPEKAVYNTLSDPDRGSRQTEKAVYNTLSDPGGGSHQIDKAVYNTLSDPGREKPSN